MDQDEDGRLVDYASAKTEDTGREKHVPIVTSRGNIVNVMVGGVPHPMEEKHYIEWIELQTNFDIYRKYLKPGEEPSAMFVLGSNEILMSVYAYCNIHGLWVKYMPRHIKSSCMGTVIDWHSER